MNRVFNFGPYCLLLVASLLLLTGMTGCDLAATSRDVAASLNGAINAAQTKWAPICTATPQQHVCITINRGVDAQNALITATESYCGWAAGPLPEGAATPPCAKNPDKQAALRAALTNANQMVTEVRATVTP